jgi:hypothetical protein
MKFIFSRVLIAFIFVTLVGSAAFGKERKVSVAFTADTMVNGTLVKKGDYEIKFDDQTGELSVRKNGKEVAKATARTEKREKKADRSGIRISTEGSERRLIGVTFGGSDQEAVIA